MSGARACFSTSSAARGAGGRVTGEGEHAERRGGAGRWRGSLGSAAAVLSVELNCGAERAQPAPRPHQPLRALQDACNPGGRARSSNPRGERCAPAARTSAARGRRRSPAAMRYSSAPVAVPGVWSVREALQRAGGGDCWKLGVRVGVQGHNAGLHHLHQRLRRPESWVYSTLVVDSASFWRVIGYASVTGKFLRNISRHDNSLTA